MKNRFLAFLAILISPLAFAQSVPIKNASIAGTFLPASNNALDIGSDTSRWRAVHLGVGSDIFFGGVVQTHFHADATTGFVSLEGGELRSAVAGTNAASVVTVGGTQTLTNKTLTSPTLTTPALGVATATSINGLTLTTSSGTITITNGKTLTLSNTLTFTGTDGSSVAFGTGGTVLYNGGALGTPSSANLSNATGLPVSTGITGLGTGVAAALAVANNSAGGYSPIDGTATLTNKTISKASNTLTGVAGSGANSDITSLTGLTASPAQLSRPQSFVLAEDFVGGDNSSGQYGSNGWRTSNITGSCTYNYSAASAQHPGQVSIITAATASCAGEFYGGGNAGNLFPCPALDTVSGFEFNFVFNLSSVSGVRMRIGITNDQTNVVSTHQMCLRFDTSLGDTNWMLETRSNATTSTSDSGVAATTGWHTARIYAASAGSWQISIDGGALSTAVTTNIMAQPGYWFIGLANDGSASKTLLCDFYGCFIPTTR